MKKLIALLLLIPSLAFASIADEECHTDGTLLTTGNWEATLEAAVAGTKYRLPAGTLTPSGNVVVVKAGTSNAARVTVVPNDCATVVIAGQYQTGSFTTSAGFKVMGSAAPGILTVIPATSAAADGTIIRNMTIQQTAVGVNNRYGLRVCANVKNLTVDGVDVVSSNGNGVAIYLQNNCGPAAGNIENSTFRNITCTNTGGDGCFQTGNVSANTHGAISGVNNLIDGLYCFSIPSEQCIDLKGMAPGGGTWTIKRVYAACNNAQHGAAILVHTGTPVNSIVTIEKSVFNECNDTRSIYLGGKYGEGQLTEANWRVTIKESIFKHTGVVAWAIRDELTGTVIERNAFLNGELQFDLTIPGATTIFRDNQLSGTAIDDNRTAGLITCSNNSLFNTSGAFTSTCTNGRTDTPSWVNTAVLDFNSAQTTHVNAGSSNATFNGSARDIGMLDAPVPSSCSVETAAPTIIVCTWENNLNPPLSAATNALFTARVATVARTINTTTVENTNQTHHTLASAVTAGQAVDITCATIGCVQDSANIGGPELALNGKARTFSQFTVTNNVDAAPAAWEVAQVAYRVTRENNVIAVNTPMSVPPGTAILVEFQTNCTGDDCPPFAQKMRYTLNGGDSTPLSNSMTADNLRFFGNTDQSPYIPAEGTHTAGCLIDTAGVDVTGSVQRTSAAVPNLDLAINDCTVNAYAIIFDTDAVVGSTYAFCPVNQDGTELNGGCDEPATIFISDFPGVVAEGRPQATGRTAAAGRTQATGRVQVIQ